MIEYLLLTLAILASFGLLLFAYRKLAKKYYFAGVSSLVACLPTFTLAIFIANTMFDDSSIKRLTQEHTIATIAFRSVGEQHFRASFTQAHQKMLEYDVYGDQWQIDARIMKWGGFAAKVGMKPIYQFERLSGRYEDVQKEISSTRSVYALSKSKLEEHKNGSIWEYLIKYQEYIPWLDTQYGSASYMPMHNGAVFTIKLSQNGILARPRNFVASQSVKEWL